MIQRLACVRAEIQESDLKAPKMQFDTISMDMWKKTRPTTHSTAETVDIAATSQPSLAPFATFDATCRLLTSPPRTSLEGGGALRSDDGAFPANIIFEGFEAGVFF